MRLGSCGWLLQPLPLLRLFKARFSVLFVGTRAAERYRRQLTHQHIELRG